MKLLQPKLNTHLVTLLFGFGILGCVSHDTKLDTGAASLISNDMTAPIQACGNQPIAGYTYCRKTENYKTDELLYFYAPPIKCDKSPCVYVRIYAPNGSPALSLPITAGETSLAVSWKTLTDSPTFRASDRGMWLYCLDMTFTGEDNIEHKSTACGEIRLRITKENYTPLHNAEYDPNYTWIWCQNRWTIKMTSNGRTFVGEHCGLYGR